MQSKVNSQNVDRNLNRAFEMWQIADDLFKSQAAVPVLLVFRSDGFLETASRDNVNAAIVLI